MLQEKAERRDEKVEGMTKEHESPQQKLQRNQKTVGGVGGLEMNVKIKIGMEGTEYRKQKRIHDELVDSSSTLDKRIKVFELENGQELINDSFKKDFVQLKDDLAQQKIEIERLSSTLAESEKVRNY